MKSYTHHHSHPCSNRGTGTRQPKAYHWAPSVRRLCKVVTVFLLLLLTACGGGNDGIAVTESVGIKSYEAYTASDGTVSFDLPNGVSKTLQVLDEQNDTPVAGVWVTLTFDEEHGFFFISGDENHGFRVISTDISNKAERADSVSARNSAIHALTNDETPKAFLSSWGQVLVKNTVDGNDNGIPVAQEKVKSRLWKYFLENKVEYQATTTVGELFNIGEFLESAIDFKDDYAGVIYRVSYVGL